MSIQFYRDVHGRWKISIICAAVLALTVFTPAGFFVFGFALPVIWVALVLGITLFTGLSFTAGEEKRKKALFGVGIACICLAYLGLASWLKFDALTFWKI